MSVAQWRAIGRAMIGLGFVGVGVLRQLDRHTYPAGDWRGDPTISTIFNGLIILVGVVRSCRPRSRSIRDRA